MPEQACAAASSSALVGQGDVQHPVGGLHARPRLLSKGLLCARRAKSPESKGGVPQNWLVSGRCPVRCIVRDPLRARRRCASDWSHPSPRQHTARLGSTAPSSTGRRPIQSGPAGGTRGWITEVVPGQRSVLEGEIEKWRATASESTPRPFNAVRRRFAEEHPQRMSVLVRRCSKSEDQ